jgi:hypothetical protein
VTTLTRHQTYRVRFAPVNSTWHWEVAQYTDLRAATARATVRSLRDGGRADVMLCIYESRALWWPIACWQDGERVAVQP